MHLHDNMNYEALQVLCDVPVIGIFLPLEGDLVHIHAYAYVYPHNSHKSSKLYYCLDPICVPRLLNRLLKRKTIDYIQLAYNSNAVIEEIEPGIGYLIKSRVHHCSGIIRIFENEKVQCERN